MAYAGHARVIMKEVDLSERVPGFGGVYGAICFAAKSGTLEPTLVQNDTELLQKFTPFETIKVGYDNGYFSSMAFLQNSEQLWVRRVVGTGAKHGGISFNKLVEGASNNAWNEGEEDPTAHNFGESEVFSLYAENPGDWCNDFCVKLSVFRDEEKVALNGTNIVNAPATNATGKLGVGYQHITPAVSATAEVSEMEMTVTAVAGASGNSLSLNITNGEENAISLSDNVIEVVVTDVSTRQDVCDLLKTLTSVISEAVAENSETAVGTIAEALIATFSGGADQIITVSEGEFTVTCVAGLMGNGKTISLDGTATSGSETVIEEGNNITVKYATGITTESEIKVLLESISSISSVTAAHPTLAYESTAGGSNSVVTTGGTNASSTIAVGQHWVSGEPIRFYVDSSSVLPAELSADNTYYTVESTENTVKIAPTLQNALDGISIVLSDVGSGTMSIIPLEENNEPDSIKIQVFRNTNLNKAVETFFVSRDVDAKNGFNQNMYIENVLEGSLFIRALDNVLVLGTPKPQIVPLSMFGGDDGAPVTDGRMMLAADDFKDREKFPVTVLMDSGWATPAYQRELVGIAEERMDCVAYLSTPYSVEASSNYLNEMVNYRKQVQNISSSFAALYTPHVKVYDKYNDRPLYIAPDGYAAAALAFTAQNFEMWYPPAGFKRGMVNVLDCRRRFKSGELTTLYNAGINPVRFYAGEGIVVWGQKTLQSRPSALDRLNVRLLLVVIEPAIETYLNSFLFELNDEDTRSRCKLGLESYMDGIKGRGGVYDYRVICDKTNNSDEDTDNYQMNVDVLLQPVKGIEFIPCRIVITRTGAAMASAA